MNYSSKKPLILITNDDGIYSPGLRAAAEAAACFGDLVICAPHCQQTGMGRSFPIEATTGIIEKVENYWRDREMDEKSSVYAIHGSPALSVAHGVMELAGRKPDLCISGINYGENLGQVLTCSGTVGAALEAVSHGISAIAISVAADLDSQRSENYAQTDWRVAQWVLKKMVYEILKDGMPEGVDLWNINVPENAVMNADNMLDKIELWEKNISNDIESPYRITTQSRQNYFCFQPPIQRDKSKPYQLPSKLDVNLNNLEESSDIYAIYIDRKISITPITVDMTAKNYILANKK